MKSWVLLAVAAYILNAINGVTDKFLLSGAVRKPISYTFFTSILSFLIVFAIPFGARFPTAAQAGVAFLAGSAFTFALMFLYMAIQQSSVSRVLPIQGGLIPVFTLLLAYFLLGERLLDSQYLAFIFLVIGAVMMSVRKNDADGKVRPQALTEAMFAAICFSVSFVLTKWLYESAGFVSGIVWTRVSMGILALSFLLIPSLRRDIFEVTKSSRKSNRTLFYISKSIGAVSGLLENLAIAMGSVTIVKALQGTQYIFLLALTSFLTIYFPKVLKEHISRNILILKFSAIALITVGLVLLGI